jgi:hypothetical protein
MIKAIVTNNILHQNLVLPKTNQWYIICYSIVKNAYSDSNSKEMPEKS